MKKFNSLELAQRYIKELGFTLKHVHNHKEDRSYIYQSGRRSMYLKSTFDYLNDNTLEMGTVWTLQTF